LKQQISLERTKIEEERNSPASNPNFAHQIVSPKEFWQDKKFLPFADWVEHNFFEPTTVNTFGKEWDYSNAQLLKLHDIQRRITNLVLTPDHRGKFPYETIVYSTIKKEGKTTLASAVGAWYGACIEPTNRILCLANDQEQAAGRIFGGMLPTLEALGCRVPKSQSSKPEIRLTNGSIIQAIANNYAGNAGDNYGLTLWSELWAYTSERARRLYDELVPVPTKRNSLRWIETYVGFKDESLLLLKLYNRIFKDTDEKHLTDKAKPVPELMDIQSEGKPCCYHIPEEGLFYFHNHSAFMGPIFMGGEDLYNDFKLRQKADLRPSQFMRLWENRWQESEGNFIHPEEYDDSITLPGPTFAPMCLAGDASQRNDTIVLVGVKKYTVKIFGEEKERYKLMYVKVWDPKDYGAKRVDKLGTKIGDMDLEETIANEVEDLYNRGLMQGPFRYDPYQMHAIAYKLREKGIPCVEFTQQGDRLKADTFLGKIIRKGELDMYYHPVLEQHIKNAKVKEYENEQVRLIKGTHSKANKIDGAVALAMASYGASIFKEHDGDDDYKTSSKKSLRDAR
jgi:hypothetical protein